MRAAVVTGAASGIGRAIARRLVSDGWDVLAVDLEPAGGPGEPFEADLTTREGNRAAIDAALERFGRLDAVVPNAGVQHVAPVEEFPEDRWDAMLALLLTSPFLLARAAWPALRESGDGRFVGRRLRARPRRVAVQERVRVGQARAARARRRRSRSRAPSTASSPPRSARLRAHAVGGEAGPPTQAHGVSEQEALDDVILAPHAIKRLIEPEEVADTVAFLLGPTGRAFSGAAVTMDLGWTAR